LDITAQYRLKKQKLLAGVVTISIHMLMVTTPKVKEKFNTRISVKSIEKLML
jgi:hypothetical protein